MATSAYRTTPEAGISAEHVSGGGTPPPYRRLYQLLLPERKDLGTVFLFAVFSGVLYLASPLAVDIVVNNLAFGSSEGVYIQALVLLSLALFGFLCLMGLVRGAQYYVTELIQRRLFIRLTADMVYRLPRVKMGALDQKLGPDLVNRFFDMITVQKGASLLLLDGINLALGAAIGLLILGFYHPFLLLFDLLLIGSVILILWGMGRGAVKSSVRESYAKHDVASWLEQVAMFPYLFKGDGASRLAAARADQLADEWLEARGRHYRVVFRQIVGLLALQAIASAALLGVGGFLVLEAELTLGQLVAAELIVSTIVANLASMGKHAEFLYDALAAVDKIGYVVDLPVERETGDVPAVPDDEGGAVIAVNQLGFSYEPGKPVLKDVSFSVEPGERVALVGAAGYGVSTLMDILMGIRTPQSGTVQVDHVDVRNWDLQEFRRRAILVRGHDLVAASVLENVRFGRDEISRSQVEDALEQAGILEDVLGLPGGLDTELMVGGRPLSHSQRSRLVLARALLGRPRLLLLDENMENLKPDEREQLSQVVFDRNQDWTVLVSTRNPDIIARCDRSIDMAELSPHRGEGGA